MDFGSPGLVPDSIRLAWASRRWALRAFQRFDSAGILSPILSPTAVINRAMWCDSLELIVQ